MLRAAALYLVLVGLFYAASYGAMYLAVPFIRLISEVGISRFLAVLGGVTAALAILFLLDLEKLSATYRKWNRYTWFDFIKGPVVGFALGIGFVWLNLFRVEILPFKYIWVYLLLLFVFALLLDWKQRSRTRKRHPDINALLRKERRTRR